MKVAGASPSVPHCDQPGEGNGGSLSYEAPQVIDYGTLVQLTAGQQDGEATDRDFPSNTPKRDLTFS